MGIFNLFKRNKNANGNNSTLADFKPDYPYPFGYKICWYAVKNETSKSIIEKLNLKIISESNWEKGINKVYNSSEYVFVSPLVMDYILVVNICPDDNHDIIKNHAMLFSELQYFGSHRVSEYNAYAKFCDGKAIRGYCYVGETGEITWCEGAVTPEEINLGYDKFPSNTEEMLSDDFDYENVPDEESVIAMAKAWGVDVTFEDKTYEKGTGFICKFVS